MHFPWKRFWCPQNGTFSLADGGYLVDPDDEANKPFCADVVPFDALTHIPCLALLGEPGIGKSTTMRTELKSAERSAQQTGDKLDWLDLKGYGNEERLVRRLFESSTFHEWLSGTHTLHLFLDSLDECRLQVKSVASIVIEILREHAAHLNRLRVRIACRTADWPNQLEHGLPELWGEDAVGVYELVPLRRSDIATAAATMKLDADAFLSEVARVRGEPLAIKPVTLAFLLNTYVRDSRLPATQVDLYSIGCRLLTEETSESRRDAGGTGRLSAKQRVAVAERLGALMVFCKKAAIFTGVDVGDTSEDDVAVSDLAGGRETVGHDSFQVGEQEIREVLDTGLFSGRGSQRLGFAHQTYAEFLAARYLHNHNMDLTQTLSLIHHSEDDSGRVIPQLGETTAWLAGMDHNVFNSIIDDDPQVLLRSDVGKADEQVRASLVESLLGLFDAEKLTDSDWGLRAHYGKLQHSSLASQLEPFIRDRTKGRIVRRVAIDIAEACGVQQLEQLLANTALASDDDPHIRDQAAHAVAVIGDDETRARLKPLALSSGHDDQDDQLKGHSLRALWPEQITVDEVFDSLKPPKEPRLHGAYSDFVSRRFLEHLSIEDLPRALQWVASLPRFGGSLSWFRDLSSDILYQAWDHLDKDSVLQAFVHAAISRFQFNDDVFARRLGQDEEDPLGKDTEKRRRLLRALLPPVLHIKYGAINLVTSDRFVRSEDALWLIDWLNGEPDENVQHGIAELVRLSFNSQCRRHVDAIVVAAKTNPILAEEFQAFIEPVELSSERAAKLRENFRRDQRHTQPSPLLDPPVEQRIERCLESFESGNLHAWWHLNREMTLRPTSTHYQGQDELEADLTTLPGWEPADAPTRARIVQAAERYLVGADPHTESWLGSDTFHRPAAAGYRALLLLSNEAVDRLKTLPVDVWKRWAPITLAYPTGSGFAGEEVHQGIVKITYDRAPNEIIETLVGLIDKENENRDSLFINRKVEFCWDHRLAGTLADKVTDAALKPSIMATLLADLLDHGVAIARKFAESLVTTPVPTDEPARERAMTAASALILHSHDAGWGVIWPAVQHDEAFGRDLMLAVAHSPKTDDEESFPRRLSEEQLADLYIWLAQHFTHKEDPDSNGWVGPRESVAHFRDSVLRALQARGSQHACLALDRITRQLPHLDWLKWVALEAKQIMLRETWRPPTPAQFLELTHHAQSRLVQSARHLLDVLVESTRRLEAKLQGETPAAPDLWDQLTPGKFRPKDENHFSDYAKRWLHDDLQRCGIVASREVQIRRGEGEGTGERTDIHVTAVVEGTDADSLSQVRVIIEAKGCWHRELKTSMQSQLVDRYLKDIECQHGLYLVGWFSCVQWDDDDQRKRHAPDWTIEEAQQYFDQQARELADGATVVKAVVINTALR